ncbi:winged helix-turn-helix transcriptional regulator [Streptomyces silvisoli]|uniref:Helix-turn-helix domain-containing protein n=1 Tax=Streptomyces silvisoli TaxID=3034235 RepID=A0ABT5ZRT8_9ACTN|nr:helix-turn-helix domain-containing protein [Streptomyces silvisoli]MDF3292436.1 helix-turn-helix domain-containing protein [Streptomyces silvisoli]
MATTGLPRTTLNDLSRVTESLEMLAPRWSVWALMTLSSQPLRYAEIKSRLPWLHDGQLHPRLRHLTDAGVVERTEYAPRHVTYGLTRRGAELMPVLTVIATWGDAHLEKDLVRNKTTGEMEPERIPAAENVEDALTLISPRHATPILWTLKSHGAATAKTLAVEAMPGYGLTAVYKPLDRLVADGLVTATGTGDFQLSASGQALAPVFQTVSAWAGGRPLADAGAHPLWGQGPAPSQARSAPWATTQTRLPAPTAPAVPAAVPALATTPPASTAWKASDLFSHQIPARPIAPAGGPRR